MTIQLPPLPQPFPFAIHPSFMQGNTSPYLDQDIYDHSPFEQATRAYADRFELYQNAEQRERLANIHCSWLGSMMYPVGSDELLQVGIDFCMWAFAYDDEYCDEGDISSKPDKFIQASAEIWRQFESPEYALSQDRYALAARDLRIRLDKYAKPEQTGRFVESMRIYMMAEMWKAINPVPSVNDYVSMRVTGGGAWSFPTLGHVIANVDIPQRGHEDRRIRALFEMLAHLMAWETEPHAYLKEMTRGSNYKEHNLIRVLIRERQCSFEAAIDEYLDMRLRLLGLFLRLKADVEKDACEGVKAYIESVIRYYVGATVWSQNTRRYKSMSGNTDEGAFVGGQLTEPLTLSTFNSTKPIEIDALKWWWKYDPLVSKAIITLPNIYSPFSHIQHPKADQFDQSTAQWLQHWELYWDDQQRQRMIRPGWGVLASLAYPKGTDELIQIASDWMAWAFAWDDEWCDESPVTKKPEDMIIAFAKISRALECPEFPVDPNDRYALSMQELRIRLAQHATPAQVNRVVEAQKGYFMVEMIKAASLSPGLNECTFMRLTGGGGMVFPVLTHVVAGIDISQDEFLDRRIAAMTEMAATLVVWENEFFSYAKESMRASLDERGHNLIDAVRREFNYTEQQALSWFNVMHDRIIGLFVRLREELLQDASPEVERYIEALINYQTGILEWHRTDERYRVLGPGDSTLCYEGGHSTDQPHDQSFDPVPIPSIQWWWDYDPARPASTKKFHPNDRVAEAREAGREFNAHQEPYTYKQQRR